MTFWDSAIEQSSELNNSRTKDRRTAGRGLCPVQEKVLPPSRGVSCLAKEIIAMTPIDKTLISNLLAQAAENPRLRQNYDLRSSEEDGSQRMLNAMLPGTVVPVHRHPRSNESVVLLCGKVVEVTYDDGGNELERVCMDASAGIFGCVVPAGAWHTVEVLEPSVIMEVKDGRYGEDGSESR